MYVSSKEKKMLFSVPGTSSHSYLCLCRVSISGIMKAKKLEIWGGRQAQWIPTSTPWSTVSGKSTICVLIFLWLSWGFKTICLLTLEIPVSFETQRQGSIFKKFWRIQNAYRERQLKNPKMADADEADALEALEGNHIQKQPERLTTAYTGFLIAVRQWHNTVVYRD